MLQQNMEKIELLEPIKYVKIDKPNQNIFLELLWPVISD